MAFLIGLLLLVICYFILYTLSRQDFVLMRKDIMTEKMFDYSFIYIAGGIIVSRIFYITEQNKFALFQPLAFLHIFKNPGLSVIGFFLGGGIILIALAWKKKVASRVVDIFYLASFPLFLVAILQTPGLSLYVRLGVVMFSIFLFLVLTKLLRDYQLKDGSTSLLILIAVSSFYIVASFFAPYDRIIFNLSLFQIINAIIFLVSSIILLRVEKIV